MTLIYPSSKALEIVQPFRGQLFKAAIVNAALQCPHCYGIKSPSYAICRGCEALDDVTFGRAPSWYGTMVDYSTPLYWQFNNYKKFTAATQPQLLVVTALLSLAGWTHANAIAKALGGDPTAVCPVPSSRGTPVSAQRLSSAIQKCGLMKDHFAEVLRANPAIVRAKRTVQPEYFEPTKSLRGQRIVLIEDLTASGSTAFSAWVAVKRAGADAVILTVARGVNPSFPGASSVIEQLPEPGWTKYFAPSAQQG
ncbi:MAG: phosphoribosyltransferase [Gemmatimonadaceae bacterium]|nr:phosphoribosyltransferase [Gemmatimonadaceae bacterium]